MPHMLSGVLVLGQFILKVCGQIVSSTSDLVTLPSVALQVPHLLCLFFKEQS